MVSREPYYTRTCKTAMTSVHIFHPAIASHLIHECALYVGRVLIGILGLCMATGM